MPHRIRSGQPLGLEVRQLFDQQIVAAVACLTARRANGGHRVHDARQHIKKARALLQLASRPLGGAWEDIDEELRIANRALGPIADATRHGETLARVRRHAVAHLPAALFDMVRMRLRANASALEERATRDGVQARTVRLLDSVRRQALAWNLSKLDVDAIVHEVRASHATVRHARRRASHRPTVDAFHDWRRRVEREWRLFRLIEDLTGARFSDERHQLAVLDACLGHLHDLNTLALAIAADSPLSRHDTARLIVLLRTLARDERRRAHALAAVLDERPSDLAHRIRALWGAKPRPAVIGEQPWLRRA